MEANYLPESYANYSFDLLLEETGYVPAFAVLLVFPLIAIGISYFLLKQKSRKVLYLLLIAFVLCNGVYLAVKPISYWVTNISAGVLLVVAVAVKISRR